MVPEPEDPPGGGRDDGEQLGDGLARTVGDRRRVAVSIVVGLLLATGVVLLIGRASGFARFVDRLRDADARWLVAALVVQSASITGYVIAFRTILDPPHRRIGLRGTGHIVLASLGATRLLAAAGAGGLAVNYWALRRLGVAAREAVVRVLALNTLLYAVFGMIGVAAAAWLAATGGAPAGITVPWLVVVAGCVAAGAFVSHPARAGRLSAEPPPRPDGRRLAALARRGFATAVAGVVRVRPVLAHPGRHRGLIGGAALYWAGDILCLAAGLAAFAVDVSVPVLLLGYTTGYVANVLPLPTGGVGGVDAAMTFALAALGVPLEDALAGVIAYRFVGFWLPTIPAVWALVTLPRLGRTLTAAATGT
jgi:uncharacterized membrane protein YbhN (UPF0104 family)